MQLRSYQEDTLLAMQSFFEQNKNHFVLASAPSSGKTTMAIGFAKRTKNKKFLILTHGQNVLKEMWKKEIETSLSDEDQKRVDYIIPQQVRGGKKVDQYDFIIIDEAHEFTFATMVANILEQNPNAKIIYLTGTPSKFIYRNKKLKSSGKGGKYYIHIIPANEIVKQGFIEDPYIGLFSTTANLKDADYNSDGDVKEAAYKKLEKNTEASVENLLEALVGRLKSKATKNKPNLAKLAKNLPSIGGVDKTMIACASIRQAERVNAYLLKKGYKSIISHSQEDLNSENIVGPDGFMSNPDIKFLVVVDRGILGFNMPELINVVDMTCSRNIDRTYQLFARVMRSFEGRDKYFFKLTSEEEKVNTKFIVSAAISLAWREFIEKFDGKNLNDMLIPVFRSKRENKGAKKGKTGQKSVKIAPIDEMFGLKIKAMQLMTNIYNKDGEILNEYAMMKYGDIRREVFDERINMVWSVDEILKQIRLDRENKKDAAHAG